MNCSANGPSFTSSRYIFFQKGPRSKGYDIFHPAIEGVYWNLKLFGIVTDLCRDL